MPSGRWSNPLRRKKENTSLAAVPTRSTHEISPYGVKVLVEGTDPTLDIVAIHGLNGHREKTWTVNGVNWLRDFIPTEIPNARIITWGYDANTHSASRINSQYIYHHANTLVSDLCLRRRQTKTQRRPIVFVAHSLGGIVLKSALIHSDAARKGALEEHRSIKLSTYGIFFMGTPHQGGSGVHLAELMLKVASIFVKADNRILKHLEQDSEWLQQQHNQYGPISGDFVTKFAYETYPTQIAVGKSIMVVPNASAIIPGIADAEAVAIMADHLDMVKFSSREDGGYEKVSGHLKLLAEDAPGVVDARWVEQDRMREAPSKLHKNFSISFSLSGVPEIQNFVGRGSELSQLNETFQGNESLRRTVLLQGLGGIGKTQLAVTFVKKQRDNFSAVFWMNGKNEDTLKQSFADVAKQIYEEHPSSTLLKIAAESKDSDQVVEAVKQWLSVKDNTKWIMVFDNIDNPKLPGTDDPQAYDIKSYFPRADQGFILITTRSTRLKIGKVIPLKKLQDTRESIEILANMSDRQISDQDPHAIQLAKELDGLPLALATAGAYLCQVSTSLENYLAHYHKSWMKLQKTSPRLESYEDALYSTWNISYEHICSQNESAGKLLQLWGYFDNQDLWYELLARGGVFGPEWFSDMIRDELSFNKAVRLLCDHALIEPHRVSGGYGMHSCVHSWITYALNSERDILMAELACTCVGYAVPDEFVLQYWVLQQRLLPHANKCLESIHDGLLFTSGKYHILKAASNLGDLYYEQSKFKEAENIYNLLLTRYEMIEGAEHLSTLQMFNRLGNLYLKEKKWNEAEEKYLRALTGSEKIWGVENGMTLHVVHNLGLLYLYQNKLKKSEKWVLRALTGYEKILGVEHIRTLELIGTMGRLYEKQNKMKEAEEMYLRSLVGWGKDSNDEQKWKMGVLCDLGNLYSQQNKMKEAEEMFLRALTGYEEMLGAVHGTTLDTVNSLGCVYSKQGKTTEAEEMLLRALTALEKISSVEHEQTLNTVINLGTLYWNQDRMTEAEEMRLRALKGYEKTLGVEHKCTLDIKWDLALLYKKKNQLQQAKELLELVVEGYTKTLGADHQETIEASELLNRWMNDA